MEIIKLKFSEDGDMNCSICENEYPIRDILMLTKARVDKDDNDPIVVRWKDEGEILLCPRCQILFEKSLEILRNSYDLKNYPGKTGFSKEI